VRTQPWKIPTTNPLNHLQRKSSTVFRARCKQQVYALFHGQRPSPTAIKALLLPVIERSQSDVSPNLQGFGDFVKRSMLGLGIGV